MSIVLDRVLAEDIPALWPHLKPLFARACDADPTGLTPDQIRDDALAGKRLIWTLADRDRTPPLIAAFSTADDGDTVNIGPLAGDDMETWLPLLAELERHAKEAGFTATHIEGRIGWTKVLRAYGYQPVRISLKKVL